VRAAAEQRDIPSPAAPEGRPAVTDVREALLAGLAGRPFRFQITACEEAVVAGTRRLADAMAELGVAPGLLAREGESLRPGQVVLQGRGTPAQIARAEESLIALVAKTSGVATAAARLKELAGSRARVVCGAWKKVRPEIRGDLREAAAVGGVGVRMLDTPFVYLDKNHVRMLGGVSPAVRQARSIPGRAVVVQLRGDLEDIREEARQALAEGAAVLMVDTGRREDLVAVAEVVGAAGAAARVAFGGGVGFDSLAATIDAGATIVDVGRAILDAPMTDLRLDVI
jgi:nicotinate-nucleotide pyrophosphorylase (carboxylating)